MATNFHGRSIQSAINNIADTYDITDVQAARVFDGEANASVERGYYEQ